MQYDQRLKHKRTMIPTVALWVGEMLRNEPREISRDQISVGVMCRARGGYQRHYRAGVDLGIGKSLTIYN